MYGGNDAKAHEFHRDRISGDFSRVKLTNGEVWEKLAVDTPLLGAPLATHHGWI